MPVKTTDCFGCQVHAPNAHAHLTADAMGAIDNSTAVSRDTKRRMNSAQGLNTDDVYRAADQMRWNGDADGASALITTVHAMDRVRRRETPSMATQIREQQAAYDMWLRGSDSLVAQWARPRY